VAILPLDKILSYIHGLDNSIKKHELEVQLTALIQSGFVSEIDYYDSQMETLFLNCN
jgi:hypothetical protein